VAAFSRSKPWERQCGEPSKAFAAFVRYRDLAPEHRSLDRAWREAHPQKPLNRRSKTWAAWSSQWGWIARAEAWDAETDRLRREKFLADQREVVARHQRAANAAINIALIPARAVLQRLNTPGFQEELAGLSAIGLLREALRASTALPALIAAERAAYGLATVDVVVEDRRELERSRQIADVIAASPRLVELATAALDEMVQAEAALGGGSTE
jgi:hypothetical protein